MTYDNESLCIGCTGRGVLSHLRVRLCGHLSVGLPLHHGTGLRASHLVQNLSL